MKRHCCNRTRTNVYGRSCDFCMNTYFVELSQTMVVCLGGLRSMKSMVKYLESCVKYICTWSNLCLHVVKHLQEFEQKLLSLLLKKKGRYHHSVCVFFVFFVFNNQSV